MLKILKAHIKIVLYYITGHSVVVHKEFYRLHESTLEMSKISKLLLLIDEGRIGSWKGKSIDEITL